MKHLATFETPIEAHLLIARLQGSGIAAVARDEHAVSLNAFASHAFGGVKVDVADEDFERALTVMKERPDQPPGGESRR